MLDRKRFQVFLRISVIPPQIWDVNSWQPEEDFIIMYNFFKTMGKLKMLFDRSRNRTRNHADGYRRNCNHFSVDTCGIRSSVDIYANYYMYKYFNSNLDIIAHQSKMLIATQT